MTAGPALSACRRSAPTTAPQPEVDAEPSPDLLGSILSGQSLLMMNGADIVIHRDGSLSAKKAGEQLCPGLGAARPGGGPRAADPAALGFTAEQWVRALKVPLIQLVVGFQVAHRLSSPRYSCFSVLTAPGTSAGPSPQIWAPVGFRAGEGLAVEGRLGHTAAVCSNLGCCPLFKGPSEPRPFLTHR